MSQPPFVAATTPDAEGRLVLDAAWQQGRGVYGGVPAAAMVRAMAARVADPDRPLRTLTVHFCAPAAPGPVRVEAEVVRAGRRVSHATARVTGAGGLLALATASFGATRPHAPAWEERVRPSGPDPAGLPSLPVADLGGPEFTRFFDYRHGGGDTLWSGAETARLRTWIRPGVPQPVDAALAIGLLDAGPPAPAVRDTAPRPVASVDLRMQLLHPLPLAGLDPAGFWYLDARSRSVSEGYAEEMTRLFAPDGRPVATCQQLIAILG